MKKDRLYFLTFISIAVVFLIIASFSLRYFIKVSVDQLIEVQVESSKREAKEVASLINYQLAAGLSKDDITANLQSTIEDTDSETWFISLLDWSVKQICHPDKTEIGQQVQSNQVLLSSLKEKNSSDELNELFVTGKMSNVANEDIRESEIIYISPVKNSDWIVAANVNISKVSRQVKTLKNNFYIIFTIMGVLIILLSFLAVRIIGSRYEKQLELKNTDLAFEVVNLSKLNADLVNYKEEIVKNSNIGQSETTTETGKKRILTYMRNELVPIHIEEISYVYTENTITYVVGFNNKKSTTNASLDDIYTSLDASLFFRANRQFIISITAIDKIIKYGNSQLKILVQSNNEVEIIISKNKAAEFKQWLNS